MSEAALMAATAKRIAVEKIGLIRTKAAVLWSKAAAVGNAIWAVGNGVLTGSIGATTLALHALKAAIMSTGIGALALLIVGLVVAVFSYVSATDSSTAAQEREAAATRASRDALLEKTNAVLESANALEENIAREHELQDAESESEKSLIKKQHHLKDMQASMQRMIDVQTENNKLLAEHGHDAAWLKRNQGNIDIMNERISAYEEQIRLQHEYVRGAEAEVEADKKAEEERKASASRGKARRAQRKKDAESLKKLSEELLLLEEEDAEKRAQLKRELDLANELSAAGEIKNKKLRLETLKTIQDIYDQEEINRLKKIEDEKQKVIDDAAAEKKKKAKEDADALKADQIKATDEFLEEIRRKNMEDRDRDIEDAEKHFDEMMKAEGLTGDEKMQLLIDHQETIKEINDGYDEQELAKQDEINAQKLDAIMQLADAFSANMDARLSELDNAMNKELAVEGLTETQKEDIQKKFQKKKDRIAKRQKAIQAAQAAINTFVGATRAVSDLGPIAGPIAAVAITAGGLAAIRQIYAQDVGDGGGGGDTPSVEETPAPKTGSFTLSGGAPEQPPVKAYVVTDEMTDSQNQLEDIRQESTI